jgi:hypothetical protein
MPKFPTYRDNLPKCLRIFNPYHYIWLAYWIYFRPTALKCYFYQALPELYTDEARAGFFRRWGTPAYRNLYIMVPVVSLLLALLLSFPVALFSGWILDVPVDWGELRDNVMVGVALGVMFGMAFGMVGRVIGGSAIGSVLGVAFGVTIGILGGMTLGVALGVSFTNIMDGAVTVIAIFGLVGGMAVTVDVEVGIAVCLTFGMMGIVSFGAEFLVFKIFGVRFGALLARWVMSCAFIVGAFRGILYPFQCGLALFSICPKVRHPLEWDELTILPLPWTRRMLAQRLRKNESQGLNFLANVWRNLFCRPSLQTVFYRYFHKHATPLRFLYKLLTNPELDEYMLVPVTTQHWTYNVSVRRVFLGELALQHIEATQNPRFRRSSWWLNLHIYKRPHTPLTRFAGMLYDLLDEQAIEADEINLSSYSETYNSLATYPDGKEIALSFEAMAAFLSYRELSALPEAEKITSNLTQSIFFRDSIRRTVLIALTRLGRVGADIAVYRDAVDNPKQLAALARATGELNDLNEYVCQEVMVPEQFLLRKIIHQWQQLIIEAIGDLGKSGGISQSQTEVEVVNKKNFSPS